MIPTKKATFTGSLFPVVFLILNSLDQCERIILLQQFFTTAKVKNSSIISKYLAYFFLVNKKNYYFNSILVKIGQ